MRQWKKKNKVTNTMIVTAEDVKKNAYDRIKKASIC